MNEKPVGKINDSAGILRGARRDALVADTGNTNRQAFNDARNAIIHALEELEGSDADMSDETGGNDGTDEG